MSGFGPRLGTLPGTLLADGTSYDEQNELCIPPIINIVWRSNTKV